MLLELQNIVKSFPTKKNFWKKTVESVHALNDVSLQVAEGQTVGLVGESGCGKSTLARIAARLIAPDSGKVVFGGEDLTALGEEDLRPKRREFQMIFQDPYSSLNPRMSVGQILQEPLKVQRLGSRAEQREKVFHILEKVGLAPESFAKYPHEFSGGQRQRIGIARALMLYPKLVIADEPVSALDVSIQAQIINLLEDLQQEFQLTYLFIAHDLKVVRHISDRIVVMYLGRVMEEIASDDLMQARHPYTQALLSAVLVPDPRAPRRKRRLTGDIPSPIDLPKGCVFHTRCPYAQAICREQVPSLSQPSVAHPVACHLVDAIPGYSELEKN